MKPTALDWAQEHLGWPAPEVLLDPPGAGLGVVTELARKKIQARIAGLRGGAEMRIGVLANDFSAADTQPVLAIVCDFPRAVPTATLHELHRLAWNFSHAPALLVSEPHRLRLFTCCEPPEKEVTETLGAELIEEGIDFTQATSEVATSALHWINLAEGVLARRYPKRFRRNQRADTTLLDNLKAVRNRLTQGDSARPALATDTVHDLLARLIFVQFLFQRQDSDGQSALDEAFLLRHHKEGRLRGRHKDLASVLRDHGDTYTLFRLLDQRFNGDLFPGKDLPTDQRNQAWAGEMVQVRQAHLEFLAAFVAGESDLLSGQLALWPMYAFDAIPLEFVSSIYEAFVHKSGSTVYTPVPLVDFLLDGVLPWGGTDWDLRILDPACGSGVFLVRAFQRLVHRWRRAFPDEKPDGELLAGLLENNLYGVDIDPAAVRVASFSLYLALCDELDPRSYWEQIRLPCLRNRRLIQGDFFDETRPGLNTETDAGRYDLVVGNPPWEKGSGKSADATLNIAGQWSKKYDWRIPATDIGALFLAKAAYLTGAGGSFSLMQSATTLLTNQSGPSRRFFERLLMTFDLREIINFSSVRFGLFTKAVGPVAIFSGSPGSPTDAQDVAYWTVKPFGNLNGVYAFEIGPYDVHQISRAYLLKHPETLTALTWGGQRDINLLERARQYGSLKDWFDQGIIYKRLGLMRGRKSKKRIRQQEVVDRKILEVSDFPEKSFIKLDSATLPRNEDPFTKVGDSTDWSAFSSPQALVKRSWTTRHNRFRAVIVEGEPTICSDHYFSVCATNKDPCLTESVSLTFNSIFATYFLLLTSGRFANYRPSPIISDFMQVPCVPPQTGLLDSLTSFEQIDERARVAYGFSRNEWALVEDLFEYTLPFFKGGKTAAPRQPTERGEGSTLFVYGRWLIDALRATFGDRREWSVRVFEERDDRRLPIRLVALYLGSSVDADTVQATPLESQTLADELLRLQHHLTRQDEQTGFVYRRILRVYDSVDGVPTVFIAKPDEARFWTRSLAMRDADQIVADLVATQWGGSDP